MKYALYLLAVVALLWLYWYYFSKTKAKKEEQQAQKEPSDINLERGNSAREVAEQYRNDIKVDRNGFELIFG